MRAEDGDRFNRDDRLQIWSDELEQLRGIQPSKFRLDGKNADGVKHTREVEEEAAGICRNVLNKRGTAQWLESLSMMLWFG